MAFTGFFFFLLLCQKTPCLLHEKCTGFLLAGANVWVTATVNQKYSQTFLLSLFFPPSVTSKWWTAEVLFPWDMNLCSTSCDSRIQSTFPCIIKLILFLLLYLLKGICSHRDSPDFCFGISWKFKTGRIFPHINEYFNQYWTPDILFISPTLIYFCLWVLYQTHKGNKAWVGRLQMNIFELYLERKPL